MKNLYELFEIREQPYLSDFEKRELDEILKMEGETE